MLVVAHYLLGLASLTWKIWTQQTQIAPKKPRWLENCHPGFQKSQRCVLGWMAFVTCSDVAAGSDDCCRQSLSHAGRFAQADLTAEAQVWALITTEITSGIRQGELRTHLQRCCSATPRAGPLMSATAVGCDGQLLHDLTLYCRSSGPQSGGSERDCPRCSQVGSKCHGS